MSSLGGNVGSSGLCVIVNIIIGRWIFSRVSGWLLLFVMVNWIGF